MLHKELKVYKNTLKLLKTRHARSYWISVLLAPAPEVSVIAQLRLSHSLDRGLEIG